MIWRWRKKRRQGLATIPKVIALLALLVACSRSPVVEYYVLAPADGRVHPSAEMPAKIVAITLPGLPSYVDMDEIVERLPANGVKIHEHQRWASDLDKMIRDFFVAALQQRRQGYSVVAHETKFARRASVQWQGVFTKLDIHQGREIDLALSWHLVTVGGNVLHGQNEIRVSEPLADATIANTVVSLNRMLDKVADEIAAGIETAAVRFE